MLQTSTHRNEIHPNFSVAGIFALALPLTTLHAQIMVVEEFTNVGFPEYATTKNRIDSLLKDKAHKYCQIKYHTKTPDSSSLYSNQVASRLEDLNLNPSMPSVLIDGTHLPLGNYPIGSTSNLSSQKLDSLYAAKPNALLTFLDLASPFRQTLKSVTEPVVTPPSWPTGQKLFIPGFGRRNG
ncbi:MAG: hypothetical protein IPJ54_11650 [Saprospiraceae bacterium]|nr:hypothetical protein [Saprospiraceae bacterium]